MNESIETKYNIIYVGKERFYKVDLSNSLLDLENTLPFCFKYHNIKIIERSWGGMAVKICEKLDAEIEHKERQELLNFKYWFSERLTVFSETKLTNFVPCLGLYLNVNHYANRSMMSIKELLLFYHVSLSDVEFYIKRFPIAEKQEVRDYYKAQTINSFKKYMSLRGYNEERRNKIIRNIERINQELSDPILKIHVDWFLFNGYYMFVGYKIDGLKYFWNRHPYEEYKIVRRNLSVLDDYYKDRDFYDNLDVSLLGKADIENISKEIDFLFVFLKTDLITSSKLFTQISLKYPNKYNIKSPKETYLLAKLLLEKKYFFNEPYISRNEIEQKLDNEQIVYKYIYTQGYFTMKDVNKYVEKMQLKKIKNYEEFIKNISDDYIQIKENAFISKNNITINESQIEQLKDELNYYIESYGFIDSNTYKGYAVLPDVGYEWNKWLLSSMIVSYLNKDFIIEYKNCSLTKYEFTIKK